MDPSELLSNEFIVRWDEELNSLVIVHPDGERFPRPHVQIRSSTLADMTFEEASQFIGERLVLLIPALRERYVDSTTGFLREPPQV
jgi:hypothetical protein